MAAQAGRLAYAHGSAFTTEPLEAYAREVARYLPVDGPAIYPVSGGSEAIETALKLARAYHLARGRAGPPDRLRPVGELPRQHPGRARPVRAQAAAPAVRGLARAVPARVGGLSVPGGLPRRRTPWAPPTSWPPSSIARSRPPVPGRSPRSSRSRSSGRRWRPSSRPTATGRRSRRSAAATACCSSPTRS